MLSVLTCIGILVKEPKRSYTKDGRERSYFSISVKRNDNLNNYDILSFIAWEDVAKFINDYLHTDDVISVVARPVTSSYRNKHNEKVKKVHFFVSNVSFICHKERLLLNEFEGNTFEEMPDINYFFD